MRKRKKDKVKLIKTVVILFLILLTVGGISLYVYNSFFNTKPVIRQEENIVTLDNNFYKIDYLIVNKYITTIKNTEVQKYNVNEQDNPYMIKIEDNNVLVADDLSLDDTKIDLVKASGIKGTPKVVKYLNYQKDNNFYVLTTEGDLYYADTTTEKEAIIVNEFQKINTTKIVNIYDFYLDDNITYPWYPLTIYAEDETGNLTRVNQGTLSTSFKEDYPLLDQICGGWSNEDSCVGLYISPDKNLYLMKDKENKLYQEILFKNNKIEVKDAFSIADIKIKKDGTASLNKIRYYIIGQDNYLYEVIESKDYQITEVKKYDKNRILSYKYNSDSSSYKVIINYANGKQEIFNDVSVFSSLYYRYNS